MKLFLILIYLTLSWSLITSHDPTISLKEYSIKIKDINNTKNNSTQNEFITNDAIYKDVKKIIHSSDSNIEKSKITYSFESDPIFKTEYQKYFKNHQNQENKEKLFLQKPFENDNIIPIQINNFPINNNISNINQVKKANLRKKPSPGGQGEFEDTDIFTIPFHIPKSSKVKKQSIENTDQLDKKIKQKFDNIFELLKQNIKHDSKNTGKKTKTKNNCNLTKIDYMVLRPVQTNPKCDVDEVYDPILRLCVNIDCIPIEDINLNTE